MTTPEPQHYWWQRIQPLWFRRLIGVGLVVIGLLALLTPLTPGSWLALIGLEILGLRSVALEIWHKYRPVK